jgi:polyphenol oxidase
VKDKEWIVPDWPAPANVHALITTRAGGVSVGAYASLNPADHVGDEAQAVRRNREIVRTALPSEPHWLKQVHSALVHRVSGDPKGVPEADAAVSALPNQVCVVLTADCLPVLFCADDGSEIGAAHAGWRGLAAGILERTVEAMSVPGARLLAYLGPAIGPRAFEVGPEVRAEFIAADTQAAAAFQPLPGSDKYLADLYLLARQRLARVGVTRVYGGDYCTYSEPQRFYSYRRDGATGRMAALIWLDKIAKSR